MDFDKKYSLGTSFRTCTSSTYSDSLHRCSHSWKCFVNPRVNYEYHKIMLEKDQRQNAKLSKQKLRAHSQRHLGYRSRPKSKKKESVVKSGNYYFGNAHQVQSEYMIQKQKQTTSNAAQTQQMVVISPHEFAMKEEERNYLRNKFIDHYGILHKKKF